MFSSARGNPEVGGGDNFSGFRKAVVIGEQAKEAGAQASEQAQVAASKAKGEAEKVVGGSKDTAYPFLESDTSFLECRFVLRLVFGCLAILRIEGCLSGTL